MNNAIRTYTSGFLMWLLSLSNAFGSTAPVSAKVQDSLQLDDATINRREFNDLRDSYNGNEFIYERTVEETGWWIRFKRWLSDLFKDLFNINTDAKASDMVDLALNLFYIALLILVVYFVVRAIMNKEGSWVFGRSSDKAIIPITNIETNIQETDFSQLITAAETEENYRMGIRYYYLWSLKTLANNGMIEYDVEKTNSDYLLELSSESLKQKFSYASYLYNYIWYGEFDIDAKQYEKAKRAFLELTQQLKA